jgi:uncharacterized lipoprotein YmbA
MNASVLSSALLAACLVVLGTQGCRSPQVDFTYHQLHPLAEAQPGIHSTLAVEVLPVRLPGMLRRPQVVLPGPTVADSHRWANGLEQDVQRVLVENLAVLLGSDSVVTYPSGDQLKGVCRIQLDVEQWDGQSTGFMDFRATWMIQKAGDGAPTAIRKSRLREPLKDASPAATVAAQDRILLALAKELAAELNNQK